MAIDASQVLASPQRAGVKVNPRGFGKTAGANASMGGGVVGALITAGRQTKAGKEKAEFAATSQTPEFGRLAFLAITDEEFALIKLKSGMVSLKLDEVIARVPRSEVSTIELGKGVSTCPLTMFFQNGDTWELEVPRPSRKHAEEVVRTFSG